MQITIPLKHVLPGYGIIRQTRPAALGLFTAQTLQAESQVSVSACKKKKTFYCAKLVFSKQPVLILNFRFVLLFSFLTKAK